MNICGASNAFLYILHCCIDHTPALQPTTTKTNIYTYSFIYTLAVASVFESSLFLIAVNTRCAFFQQPSPPARYAFISGVGELLKFFSLRILFFSNAFCRKPTAGKTT